ncbi:MAG: cisplatin damage response ATP-dependent DNA ligase [Alphaproteobacteria bacterium]|nr:cisplatin damage response ATP-dependent DNA ligase [Alphaproteobacteria bacterium]
MNRFAELLDALLFTPSRNGKLRLLQEYFATTPDPERGWALAALTGELSFAEAKPGQVRALAMQRVDPELFAWSLDFVGDLAETVALIWPEPAQIPLPPAADAAAGPLSPALRERGDEPLARIAAEGGSDQRSETGEGLPTLTHIVETLRGANRAEVGAHLAPWLDALDATGRWALLKLVTGALRIGVSARLAKTALAEWSGTQIAQIEEVWHGIAPPYETLFNWLEGHTAAPRVADLPVFTPLMLAQPLEEGDLAALDPRDFRAEWKWDGIRVQLVARGGERRLYSRSGDDIGGAFPDIVADIPADVTLDGELLVIRDGEVAPFNDLQQRLNRKAPDAKALRQYPTAVRVYDILRAGADDLRDLPFVERRRRLEDWYGGTSRPALDLSPLVPFADWDELKTIRAGARDRGIEGLMLKRADSLYVAGRPKGPWFKWKRGALTIDTVLMYAQRGNGKRSSFYSDYTFGAWADGALVPVGKAYSGFTDEELRRLDKWVRDNTVNRYGPVREVVPGLVLEIAFDSVHKSTRHRSGVAMRFPRVHRIRWDKPFQEADTLTTLQGLMT